MVGVRDVFHVLSDTPCHLVPGRVVTEFERALFLVSKRRLLAAEPRVMAELVTQLSNNTHMPTFHDVDYLDNQTSSNLRAQSYPVLSDPFFGHVSS